MVLLASDQPNNLDGKEKAVLSTQQDLRKMKYPNWSSTRLNQHNMVQKGTDAYTPLLPPFPQSQSHPSAYAQHPISGNNSVTKERAWNEVGSGPNFAEDDQLIMQEVEYEWFPHRCSNFHCFGHIENVCKFTKIWIPKQTVQPSSSDNTMEIDNNVLQFTLQKHVHSSPQIPDCSTAQQDNNTEHRKQFPELDADYMYSSEPDNMGPGAFIEEIDASNGYNMDNKVFEHITTRSKTTHNAWSDEAADAFQEDVDAGVIDNPEWAKMTNQIKGKKKNAKKFRKQTGLSVSVPGSSSNTWRFSFFRRENLLSTSYGL